MTRMLVLLFEVLESAKEGVTAECCLEYSSDHSFIEPFVAIFNVDECRCSFYIDKEVIIKVELLGRNHQGHLDVLERLQECSCDDSTDHTKNTILTYHCNFSF